MSNRRKRRQRRQAMTPEQRWWADRYKPVRQYDPAELRRILVEDGVVRRTPPLGWFLQAVEYLAVIDGTDAETVFIQVNSEVQSTRGLPLPTSGLAW